MNLLGIMSGTSLDGVDFALCRIAASSFRLKAHWHETFPASLRSRLKRLAAGQGGTEECARLNHDYGRFLAGKIRRRHALEPIRVQAIGLHGQTVFHGAQGRFPATWQLGEPAWLAESLGVPVIFNFRAADLAAGGQGAPLAPAFHERVFARRGKQVLVQNLGGIGNVTSLDWCRSSRKRPMVRAFDTGPANLPLNLAMEHFSGGRRHCDRGGQWAARGRSAEDGWWKGLLRHPFFRLAPPKSTGREVFGEPFLAQALKPAGERSREVVLAGLTRFVAATMVDAWQRWVEGVPDSVILCGGGIQNPELVHWIREETGRRFGPVAPPIRSCEELGWPAGAVEPAAFAWLAYCHLKGKAALMPEVTGARHPVLLGQLCPAPCG